MINKLMDRLLKSERDIRERLFLLMTIPALAGIFIVFIIELIIGADLYEVSVLGGGFAFLATSTFFSIRFNKLRLGTDIAAFFTIFALLPLGFFTGGGINGGAPLWFVFAMVFVSMAVPGKSRYFFQIACAVVQFACYLVAYKYPNLMSMRPLNVIYHDSFTSTLMVGVLISLLAGFEIAVYREESKRSTVQREEIDHLIKAQNQFFSNMSHEIRTPINTIIGLNEMILREDISEEVADDAANIQAASRLLLHLINDILDMSKIESGKMELVNSAYEVSAMVSDIVGMMWIRAHEKGLEFHVDVDPAIPAELYGDEVRIRQILINILTNAVKYTQEGSVTISIQGRRQDMETEILTCSISDTGIGIKKESIPHLFSAFRRVDEEKNRHIEGTGLGLSIVKQLVDLMHGTITVNSVYTQGSTFIVEIPQKVISERKIGEVNLEVRHAMNHLTQYRQSFEAPDARVLVVDDDAANRLVVTKLLRETKISIDTAQSGAEALKKTYENRYHVILMDHMMPEMDGIECLRAIREQVGGLCRDSKVIALTANAGSEERELYASVGFDGYLVKPVSGDELERELRRMLPQELVSEYRGNSTLAEKLGATLRTNQKKVPVTISTDSVCGTPKSIAEKYGIAVIPYHVHTDDGIFLDGIETETRGVIDYIERGEGPVHSEPPQVEEYEEFFAKQLLRSTNILHISLSSGIGKGFSVASGARQTFGNATVIDSMQVCYGAGIVVTTAAELAKKGASVSQITEEIRRMIPNIRTSFVVDNTEYLTRSGRLERAFNRFAGAFMLHPVVTVKNGRFKVQRVFAGSKMRVWKRYIALALDTKKRIDKSKVFVGYAGLSDEELKIIEAEIKRKVEFEEIVFGCVSPAIAINCGPGTFGMAFRTISEDEKSRTDVGN
ncbi:MAG: DegV family EDD domain-containing protein [Oscillospiraceae bacterium]|nr:DegV family EDD domain-containing protein [Oscillospiraceae bacterium]